MIAQRMKEAIGIGGNASGAIGNCLAQAGSRIKFRNFRELSPIHVHVRAWVNLHDVWSRRFHVHGGRYARDGESGLDVNGYGTADINLLRKIAKARGLYKQTIR